MRINISRFINREKADFSVKVLTPMFLGGANGDAELRAAPFKNALRYWWRITQGDIYHEQLREKEQALFGGICSNKETTEKPTRSRVDVVVTGAVKTGDTGEQDAIGRKMNPEANNRNMPISAYLGMGPVHFNGTYNKRRILPTETFTLSITFPKNDGAMIDTISLFKAFGSLGARSRNGWGSFELQALNNNNSLLSRDSLFKKYGKELADIFKSDKKYPFCLGTSNGKPLLWKIGNAAKWEKAMELAGAGYMDIRQQPALKFPVQKQKNSPEKRHILGYPVTNHSLLSWGGNNGRMPSQLRIIIRENNQAYDAFFFHLPHNIPKQWDNRLGKELAVWQSIHTYLDKNFTRAR